MILQYFKKKENEYKVRADKIYIEILNKSKVLVKKKYFNEINFNSSFELIVIFLVYYLKFFNKNNQTIKKKINDELMKNFVNDLDKSIRDTGISDMSIGKYVKAYVKKFYYRLKMLNPIFENDNHLELINYLNSLKLINKNNTNIMAEELINIFEDIKKNKEIK